MSYNKDWRSGETVTPDKLNAHVSSTLESMFQKNIAIVRNSNINSLAGLNTTNDFWKFEIPIRVGLTIAQGSAVVLGFSGTMRNIRASGTVAGGLHMHLDVLIDESFYLSSLAATATSDGVFKNRKNILNGYAQGKFKLFATQLEEGYHSFELVSKAPPSGDSLFYNQLMPNCFFWAEEYGVNIGQLIGANDT